MRILEQLLNNQNIESRIEERNRICINIMLSFIILILRILEVIMLESTQQVTLRDSKNLQLNLLAISCHTRRRTRNSRVQSWKRLRVKNIKDIISIIIKRAKNDQWFTSDTCIEIYSRDNFLPIEIQENGKNLFKFSILKENILPSKSKNYLNSQR